MNKWAMGAGCLLIGLVLGVVISSQGSGSEGTEGNALGVKGVAQLEQEYQNALADVSYGSPPPAAAPMAAESLQNMRHMAELLETSCKQTGVNCEYAATIRQQYNELSS
ncbi:MAG: hypothetical protein EOO38_08060, partial [Cytophagaceae bacterium]